MYYDPVKDVFASVIRNYPFTRVIFYKVLDLMFLRSWYVRKELKKIRRSTSGRKLYVYDAGTGYGQYTYFMYKKLQPVRIFAVDIKENWIKDSAKFYKDRQASGVEFAVEDLTKITHENRFDLILCVDVMEHIEDDVQVFSNFYNALRQGGFLLINTPSVYGGSDVHSEDDKSFIEEHAREGYSYEDLREKLIPLGFSVYNSKYTYGFWGDKAWRIGIKYPMLLLNRSKWFFILLPFYYLIAFPFTLLFMYLDFNSRNEIGSGINFTAKK